MTRRDVVFLLGSLPAIALTGCGPRLPTYRYRLTVEVDTPEVLRSGSSVIQVKSGLGTGPLGVVSKFVRGEAVAVDLPGGRTLFALLTSKKWGSDAAGHYAHDALPPRVTRYGNVYPENLAELVARTDVGTLTGDARPLLVTFANIRDPKTVARVDPDDLAASFGPGVRLRRITVQITDDPVTTGIEKRLGWLPQFYDKMLDGSPINNSTQLANSLSMGDFQQGAAR